MDKKKTNKKFDFEWIMMYVFYSNPAAPLLCMLNFGGYFFTNRG